MFKITQEVEELPENYTGIAEHANGNKSWYLNGKLHRVDGPACDFVNGNKYWYLNGKLHREDGPAVEYRNGDKVWYFNDKLHREDGSAVEFANGDKEWWLNNKRFSCQKTWQKKLDKSKPTCNGKVVEVDGKKYKLILTGE